MMYLIYFSEAFKLNKGKGSDGKGDTRRYNENTLGNNRMYSMHVVYFLTDLC